MCEEGIIGMVRYIKKKRVETSRRGVAMGDIEKEIHILAEMENENIIYLHQVPQKSHSSSSSSPLSSFVDLIIIIIIVIMIIIIVIFVNHHCYSRFTRTHSL